MSVIERVKSEQTVDVFQIVKLIRARRPGAVDTLVSKLCLVQSFIAPKLLVSFIKRTLVETLLVISNGLIKIFLIFPSVYLCNLEEVVTIIFTDVVSV